MYRAMFDIFEVSQLWLQQRLANKDIVLSKVNGSDNIADYLTKHVGELEAADVR